MLGKLIVIDGTDGSGKATQVQLLAERLARAGQQTFIADFPRYGQPSAFMVEKYLNGHYGTLDQIDHKLGSIFYAVDRFDAKQEIQAQLNQGKFVLSNRYVTASMAHQGGKVRNQAEREVFFKWLDDLEYGIFGIPRPDINLILHVPAEVGQKLVDEKAARGYLAGSKKRDLHEQSLDHLLAAEQVYLEISKLFPNFALIECAEGGTMKSREAINDLLWQAITPLLKAVAAN